MTAATDHLTVAELEAALAERQPQPKIKTWEMGSTVVVDMGSYADRGPVVEVTTYDGKVELWVISSMSLTPRAEGGYFRPHYMGARLVTRPGSSVHDDTNIIVTNEGTIVRGVDVDRRAIKRSQGGLNTRSVPHGQLRHVGYRNGTWGLA